jgi:hypothetical protein
MLKSEMKPGVPVYITINGKKISGVVGYGWGSTTDEPMILIKWESGGVSQVSDVLAAKVSKELLN